MLWKPSFRSSFSRTLSDVIFSSSSFNDLKFSSRRSIIGTFSLILENDLATFDVSKMVNRGK